MNESEPVATEAAMDRDDTRGGASDAFSMVPLAWLAAGCAIVGLVLSALRQALSFRSGHGIGDLLGWVGHDTLVAAVQHWCAAPVRWHLAVGWLLGDTALLLPLEGALILAATRAVAAALQPELRALRVGLPRAAWALVGLWWLAGFVGDLGGAQRIGLAGVVPFAALAIGAGLFVVIWRSAVAPPAAQRQRSCRNLLVLSLATLAVAVLAWLPAPRPDCPASGAVPWPSYAASAWFHDREPLLLGLAVLPMGVGALVWWFGLDLDRRRPGPRRLASDRAAWRAGVAGVIGRSRYVLLLLALFTAFTLGLDQCRDVMLSLAGPRSGPGADGPLALVWSVTVLVVGALSVGMLAYACWLWTRLVGMVRRPGSGAAGGADVSRRVGEFARGWARALSLVPLAVVCLLIARTTGDATAAAQLGGRGFDRTLEHTLGYLFGFALMAVASGLTFLQVRRRLSLRHPGGYYNSESDVFVLLRTGTRGRPDRRDIAADAARLPSCFDGTRRGLSRAFGGVLPWLAVRLVPLGRPVVLPMVALVLMLMLRVGMAAWPEVASQAPASLALMCLSLVWWTSVLGAIAMAEQRQTIPWGLALIVVIGVFGFGGLIDNHVLPMAPVDASDAAGQLVRARWWGAAVTVGLAALGAAWWLAGTWRGAGKPRPRTTRRRWVMAAMAMGVALVGLHVVDRQASALFRRESVSDVLPPFAEALAAWTAKLPVPTPGDDRVFLIASEGGGARSAYWTAMLLAHLHDDRGARLFDQRVVMMSGVSGGAVGEAVYSACRLQQPVPTTMVDCVSHRFAGVDPLSPLIGGFFFEDAFAQVLPVHLGRSGAVCGLPGCGFLSRALGFEREWLRQFPELARPMNGFSGAELPPLMFNSTWVESGNRAVFSTLGLAAGSIPASVDAIDRIGAVPSLISAAHAAARFPFVNPLAAVRAAASAGGEGAIAGRLADGGYHDNSGTEGLADVWRELRKTLPTGWRAQLVLIRNGRTTAACSAAPAAREPSADCLNGVAQESDLAEPLDRSRWGLYAEVLGPAVAVVNVSGIGARGRQATAALDADIREHAHAAGARPLPPWLLDQTAQAALVPLGWYLSPAARAALDVAAKACAQSPSTCTPRP